MKQKHVLNSQFSFVPAPKESKEEEHHQEEGSHQSHNQRYDDVFRIQTLVLNFFWNKH